MKGFQLLTIFPKISILDVRLVSGHASGVKVNKIRKDFQGREAATRVVLCKKVFSQNSQENTCARVSFLIKLHAWGMELC